MKITSRCLYIDCYPEGRVVYHIHKSVNDSTAGKIKVAIREWSEKTSKKQNMLEKIPWYFVQMAKVATPIQWGTHKTISQRRDSCTAVVEI